MLVRIKSTDMKTTTPTPQKVTIDYHDSALFDLFVTELKDVYWAEKYIVKNLPKMAEAATSEDLKELLNAHLDETQNQVERLEEIFQLIDKRAVGKRCDGMDGLIEESRTIIDKTEDGTLTRDVGLIASAQKIEHYEIATYGTLKTIAAVLDLDDQIIDLLTETLEEEKEVDQKLTQLAESHINEDAREEEN